MHVVAEVARDRSIETGSRLRVWWLSSICGCTVLHIMRRPHLGLFGRIRYENRWFLTSSRAGKGA